MKVLMSGFYCIEYPYVHICISFGNRVVQYTFINRKAATAQKLKKFNTGFLRPNKVDKLIHI